MANTSINKYYSGQGCLFVADRDAAGNILAYRELGNISALSVTLDATVAEHKESCSGSRLTDARLVTDLSASVSMTLQNFTKENLALLFSGDVLDSNSGTVGSGSPNVLYKNTTASSATVAKGAVFFTKHMNISSLVVKNGAATLTLTTDYTADLVTGQITITNASGITVTAGSQITAEYSYAAYSGARMLKNAINKPRAFVFRGLNTVDSNSKVRVELFNVVLDPAQSFDILTEEFAEFQVEGSVLYDSTRDSDADLGPFGRVIGDANL